MRRLDARTLTSNELLQEIGGRMAVVRLKCIIDPEIDKLIDVLLHRLVRDHPDKPDWEAYPHAIKMQVEVRRRVHEQLGSARL